MAPTTNRAKTPRPELADKRRTAGYSQTTFARAIHASANAVRAWEQGVAEPSIGFRKPIANVLGISMAEVDRLIGGRPYALNGAAPGRSGLSIFVREEQVASRIQLVDVLRLPALLQTRDYALAVERTFPGGPNAPVDLDTLVDQRLARQAVLDREPEPLELTALVPWWVLHRTRGSRHVMADQMAYLLDLVERPNIDVRVLPDAPDGLDIPSSFALLTGAASTTPDLASADGPGGAAYIETDTGITELVATFERLGAESIGADESADMIRNRRKEYRR
jgi:transcriptional regulator with XRE-family HTH domain